MAVWEVARGMQAPRARLEEAERPLLSRCVNISSDAESYQALTKHQVALIAEESCRSLAKMVRRRTLAGVTCRCPSRFLPSPTARLLLHGLR